MPRLLAVLTLLLAALIQSGCAVNRATASVDPSFSWSSVKSIHVVKEEGDNNDIDVLIADKLMARGFTVTRDPTSSAGADARLTYKDRWMWDITMYMLELTIVIRDPKTDFPLATGNSFHTSLTRKKPKEMVDEVIENVLKGGSAK